MNRSQLRALAADAFHQVLDNGVFRVLAVLCAVPILFTFVLGIREEGLSLLFGLKTWSYAELFGVFGAGVVPADPRGMVIEVVLQIVLEFLAGSIGMLVALAATSFFVPRMLEKGAAELYFHKPVSRGVLFLSRYCAGLLFVALASFILVGGMYLGLLVASGHGDPGILVAPLTLTYAFAPIYAFTLLAGVVTRSTVASLLLSAFFFLFNGCIHQGWIAWQQTAHGPALRLAESTEEETSEAALDGDASDTAEEAKESEDSEAKTSPTARFFLTILDVLHFVLPKTSDADYLGQKLRSALERPLYRDEEALVTLARLPDGLARRDESALDPWLPTADPLRTRLGLPLLAATDGETLHALWRRPAEHTETRIGERVRERIETAAQAARTLEDDLEQRADVRALERTSERFGTGFGGSEIAGTLLTWLEGQGESARTRSALVFKGTDDEAVFTLLVDARGELAPEAAAAERGRLAGKLYIDASAVEDWYPSKLAVDAPLRFNILFSVASTLAFAALVLLLGAWRLSRIDF